MAPYQKRTGTPAEGGQGLVEYALILGLVIATVILALSLMGTTTRGLFQQAGQGLQGQGGETAAAPAEDITVTVVDAAGRGLPDVRVYAYSEQGRYQGQAGRTDANGQLHFSLEEGSYRFRARHLRHDYWSATVHWPAESQTTINTQQRPFTVRVTDATGNGIANVQVYAFDANGRYVGVGGRTDAGGATVLNLTGGRYKFRASYQSRKYWSDVVDVSQTDSARINTGRRAFPVRVVDGDGAGIGGVRVYAFTEKDRYTGVSGQTGADGVARLNLAEGEFRFRADYQGKSYWSDEVDTRKADSATVQTGQRGFTVRVVDKKGHSIGGVRVHAFTEKKRYTGVSGQTNAEGVVVLSLGKGEYRFRADYQGKQYWSEEVSSDEHETTLVIKEEKEKKDD